MIKTKLSILELNKRADEVFVLEEGDFIYDIMVIDGEVKIEMEELDNVGNRFHFIYEPDMSNRPEALDYLLGLRNDFND